ncbi:MAG: hypothetical protein K6T83_07405 [Alicyclobacillus sp.]|nr:hypothetical protein [Alicyclobacillus sp.]
MRSMAVTAIVIGVVLGSACVGCGGKRNLQTGTIVVRTTQKTDASHVTGHKAGQPAPHLYPVKVLGMRKFPYPYKAMLAICSDADHQTLRKFNLIHRFLNTTETTPMGKGLGLDISDSLFMYNGSNLLSDVDYTGAPISRELTYFRGLTQERYAGDILDAYIHAGWIDTIHTYGDFSMTDQRKTRFSRDLAIHAIHTLQTHGDALSVWVDHGNKSNVDNFGSYGRARFFNYQQGANPRSPYYHTDLLIPYGVRFVWGGEEESTFGHSSIIYPIRLPDGRKVWGFHRYTSLGYSPRFGTEWIWTVDRLAQQLTPSNLALLERNHQYAIVGQHLAADNEVIPLPRNAVLALRRLATEYRQGRILVARTSRLLRYNVSQRYLRYYVTQEDGKAIVHFTSVDDPMFGAHPASLADVRGVTFYTTDPSRTEIRIGSMPLDPSLVQRNASDGRAPSISVKWYPLDTTDYSILSSRIHGVL